MDDRFRVDLTEAAPRFGVTEDEMRSLVYESPDAPDATRRHRWSRFERWVLRNEHLHPAFADYAETTRDEWHLRTWFEDHYYIPTETWREWRAHPGFPSSRHIYDSPLNHWGRQAVAAWVEERGLVRPYKYADIYDKENTDA